MMRLCFQFGGDERVQFRRAVLNLATDVGKAPLKR
jgi:hypothetical protein